MAGNNKLSGIAVQEVRDDRCAGVEWKNQNQATFNDVKDEIIVFNRRRKPELKRRFI